MTELREAIRDAICGDVDPSLLPGLDPMVDRILDEVQPLIQALGDARPYVFNRVLPPNHPEHDWRSQTASGILTTVDAALARARNPVPPKGERCPPH